MVPGTNLTYLEAATRGALLRVESYAIELDLSTAGDTFGSTTVIRFACTQPGADSFADLVAPAVREITLNGRPLDLASYQDGRIVLDRLAADNELRVVADCAYMNTGEGLHRSIDAADGRTYLYTHFEIPEARRVFTTFEQPDLKASFTFTVTAPSGWTVLSNSATPTPEPVTEGVCVWRFEPTPRISTYITAVIAGEYHQVKDIYAAPSGQVIPMSVLCRQSLAGHLDADEVLEITKQGFDYYLPLFDHPYPFDKYDQIFVPEYNIGAMENVGCVTIAEDPYLFRSKVTDAMHQARAETILHELAHMWFGDLVTMRWWDDLWLKESVATYVSLRCLVEATRWPHGWTAFANADKASGMRQDQRPSTHPIVATISDLDDVALNFDGITYAKGAAVLKQLVAWVGSKAFFAGMRTYIDRYAWGTTTLDDLLAELEAASGRDLSTWAAQWLRTAGPNTLRPAGQVDDADMFTAFSVRQEAPVSQPTLRSHRIAIGLYNRVGDELRRTLRVEVDIAGASTEVPELIGVARPDLVLLNDDDLTFAAIRLDEHSLSTVVGEVGRIADPLARALCWAATWDMVRSGEMSARQFVELVLGGIDRESDITVVQVLHGNLTQAVQSYVDPAHRSAVAARVTGAARRAANIAAVGSDLQLAWLRQLALLASTEDDLAFLEDLLTGARSLDGLDVDTELRWALLVPLVRAGRAGAARIEAELASDHTTAGQEHAAGLLAARPDPAAKAEAWAAVVDRSNLPNRTQDAIIGGPLSRVGAGFVQPDRPELLEPYVDRYFEAVPRVWSTRTLEIARNIVHGLYPRWRANDDTLARTDVLLATDLPGGLRRTLVEARDDVVRAIRAQAADRAAGAS